MSKAIRSYPKHEQEMVAERRIKAKTFGLGYWAAIDYRKRQKEQGVKAKEV